MSGSGDGATVEEVAIGGAFWGIDTRTIPNPPSTKLSQKNFFKRFLKAINQFNGIKYTPKIALGRRVTFLIYIPQYSTKML